MFSRHSCSRPQSPSSATSDSLPGPAANNKRRSTRSRLIPAAPKPKTAARKPINEAAQPKSSTSLAASAATQRSPRRRTKTMLGNPTCTPASPLITLSAIRPLSPLSVSVASSSYNDPSKSSFSPASSVSQATSQSRNKANKAASLKSSSPTRVLSKSLSARPNTIPNRIPGPRSPAVRKQPNKRNSTYTIDTPNSARASAAPSSGLNKSLPPSFKHSLDSTTFRLQLESSNSTIINTDLHAESPPVSPSRPVFHRHSISVAPVSPHQQLPSSHLAAKAKDDFPIQLDSRDELISIIQSIIGLSRLESLVHLPTVRRPDFAVPALAPSASDQSDSSQTQSSKSRNPHGFLRRLGWRSRVPMSKSNGVVLARTPNSDTTASPPFRLIGAPLSATACASCISVIGGQKHLLPIMVFRIIEEIFERGMRTPGLFRISGDSDHIQDLVRIFESSPSYGDTHELKHETLFDMCGLLKRFLWALPQAVLDPALSDLFWNACVDDEAAGVHSISSRITIAQVIFRLLPKRAFSLLVYVIAFLSQLPLFPENMATISSIAQIFGPALLGPRNAGVLGLGPASPRVVLAPPPPVHQLDPAETTQRAVDGLIWLMTHWNQITDGLLDERLPRPSRRPSPQPPASRPPTIIEECSADGHEAEIVEEMKGKPSELKKKRVAEVEDKSEMIGLATSPRNSVRSPDSGRQPVAQAYVRRHGASLKRSTSLRRSSSSSSNLAGSLSSAFNGTPPPTALVFPTESLVEELSDPAQPLHPRSASRSSSASTAFTRGTTAFSEPTQPLAVQSGIEELKDCDPVKSLPHYPDASGPHVFSFPESLPTAVPWSNSAPLITPSTPITPAPLPETTPPFSESRIRASSTSSTCSSLSSSATLPSSPPLLKSSTSVRSLPMPTSGVMIASPPLLPSAALSSTFVPASSTSSGLLPEVIYEHRRNESALTLSKPHDSHLSALRQRAVTLNPGARKPTCGSISSTFSEAQSIVDQYEAHGPSSLRRHPTLDRDERRASLLLSPPSCRSCTQPRSTNFRASISGAPRACECSNLSNRPVMGSTKATKANLILRRAMEEVSRIKEETEQVVTPDPMAALSALLRTKDAKIRAQTETIRAQAELLVESERRLAQLNSCNQRFCNDGENGDSSNGHFLSITRALRSGPDDLRVICEAGLVKMREAWEAERAAFKIQHDKLEVQLAKTERDHERVCEQLAVVRRAIGPESADS